MIGGRETWILRALAVAALAGALVLAWPPEHRLEATWTPLALEPAGPSPKLAAGLRREPGAAVDAVLDTVERPLATGSPRAVAVTWSGVLRVPRAGNWALGLYTDRPGRVWLGSTCVIAHPGAPTPLLVARSLLLAAGDYPVKIESSAGPFAVRATLVWVPPGEPLALVPATALAHVEGDAPPGAARAARPALASGALALPLGHPRELSNPVLFRWDHAALGTPAFPPLYAVALRGRLERTGEARAALTVGGALTGRVGERAVSHAAGAPLEELELAGSGPWDVDLELVAGGDDDLALRPVGARLRWPDAPVSRAALALGLAALTLGIAGARGRGWPDERAARGAAVALTCALALALRLHHYTVVPHPLETEDELIHHWNGYSLLAGTGSLGWSDLPAYGRPEATFWWGHRLHVVQPFLDWPPPMCALTGAVDRLAGARHPYDLPLDRTRLFPIALGVATTWFTYKLARQLHGGTAAPLVAAALVATLPPAVGAARLVKADGLLALLAIALVWATLRHRAAGRGRSLALVAGLALAATAVKQSGLAFAVAAVLALAAARRTGATLVALGALAAGLASYPAWGCLWDKSLYAAVQAQLAATPFKPSYVVALLSDAPLVDRSFGGGWMLFLWLTFLAPAPRGGGLVKLAVVGYTAVIGLTTWESFGWYRLPLYPLLGVLAGGALARLMERPRLPVAFAAVALMVWPALEYRLPLDHEGARPALGALTVLLLAVPTWCHGGAPCPRGVARVAGGALIGVVLALNVAVVWHLPYLDRGLFRERGPASEALAGDGAPRTVRWR